jgi:hypothetical protein
MKNEIRYLNITEGREKAESPETGGRSFGNEVAAHRPQIKKRRQI